VVAIGAIERGVSLPAEDRRRKLRNPISRALAELKPGESRTFEVWVDITPAGVSKLAFRVFGKGGYRTAPVEGEPNKLRVWRTKR
jgi:hypothetical protein